MIINKKRMDIFLKKNERLEKDVVDDDEKKHQKPIHKHKIMR